MKDMIQHRRQVFGRSAVALAVLGGMSGAHAVSFDLSNPDYRLRWDNTVRYNLGVRMEDQDNRIMRTRPTTSPTANSTRAILLQIGSMC